MSRNRVTLTEQEIWEQPQAWEWTLGALPARLGQVKGSLGSSEVVLCGCGSAYNVALACAASLRAQGIPARAETSGEVALFDEAARPWKGRTLVAASRSGETSETVWAVQRAAREGASAVAMTCEAGSALAREAPACLLLEGCAERSVVTTKSVTGMMIAGQMAAQALAGNSRPEQPLKPLPRLAQRVLEVGATIAERIWRNDFRQCAFLGSGLLWGVANEARLKMQEMALVPSVAFQVLEFRHGPMAQAAQDMLVVAMVSDAAREHEAAAVKQLAGLGATVLAIVEKADDSLRQATPFIVELDTRLEERIRQPLYLLPAHLLALKAAVSRGLNPDSPPNLSRAVIL